MSTNEITVRNHFEKEVHLGILIPGGEFPMAKARCNGRKMSGTDRKAAEPTCRQCRKIAGLPYESWAEEEARLIAEGIAAVAACEAQLIQDDLDRAEWLAAHPEAMAS